MTLYHQGLIDPKGGEGISISPPYYAMYSIYSVFVVIATLIRVYILTTICRKYANWILRNGPLIITVDFLKIETVL